ncbi:MAG TPA: exosortase A [Sphingobium sp.]|uniref:exosortase A n=1 Tax=Sphingobium sp. TaxID=1912891 RepID=UPI002ED4B92A
MLRWLLWRDWSWAMMADVQHGSIGRAAGWGLEGLGPWPRHLLLLASTALLPLLLCRDDIAAIGDIWWRMGAFHHCVLIPPILVWLVWQRRDLLAKLSPEFALRGVGMVGLGSVLWLAGAAGYVEILRQAGLVIVCQGLVMAILGMPVARALAFPLGFALFLIPAGSEFEPILQIFTARIAVMLLHVSGTPALLEGVFIQTPAGLFRVAEACSGTAFLLAMAAYGALVSVLCFQSWRRRLIFMTVAMIAALLTNGVRAFAIMKLANLTSIHNPMVQDHLVFGWVLFAVVLGFLMLASARWFDRDPDAPVADPAVLQGVGRGERGGWLVVPAVLATLLLPGLWLVVTEPAEGGLPSRPVAPAIAGWKISPGNYGEDWQPHFTGATWIGQWRYQRIGSTETVDFAIIIYDRQEEGRKLVGFGQGAAAPEGDWAVMSGARSPRQGLAEWLRGPAGRIRYVATYYLLGGTVTGNRVEAKLAGMLTRLLGGDQQAVAILLSAEQQPGTSPEHVVDDFTEAAGSAQEMADRARRMR